MSIHWQQRVPTVELVIGARGIRRFLQWIIYTQVDSMYVNTVHYGLNL
jgi:hypothetical protein